MDSVVSHEKRSLYSCQHTRVLTRGLLFSVWLLSSGLIMGTMSGALVWAGLSVDFSSVRPFHIGEQLTYELSWLNITVGTAVMSVTAAGLDGDRPFAKLITTAQSRPTINRFFPVDNRVESIFDPATLLPEHLIFKRREGKKKEDIEYLFHQKEGTVTVLNGGTAETLEMPSGTHDVISCLYYGAARCRFSLAHPWC